MGAGGLASTRAFSPPQRVTLTIEDVFWGPCLEAGGEQSALRRKAFKVWGAEEERHHRLIWDSQLLCQRDPGSRELLCLRGWGAS